MGINKRAWAILSQDEQTALSLQHGLSKSTWQSGEIMDKSHYKYLEIEQRAKRFLRVFTDHLKLYDEIVPEYIRGNGAVVKYFRYCIELRLKPQQVLDKINSEYDDRFYTKPIINKKIVKVLKAWEESDNAHEVVLFNLVKDFDRWNNFRILPKEIQEPSAFKRRVKNVYKHQIKVFKNIPKLSLQLLRKKLEIKKEPCWYLPLLIGMTPTVIRIRNTQTCLNLLNEITFYAYEQEEDAKTYIEALFHYLAKENKDCKDGLDFWPVYRESIKKAINYNTIQNITPTRKYLEVAIKKIEFV